MPPKATYYDATANARTAHSPLAGETKADVCVIGAGFTGISAALNLAERGYRVVVLEAGTIGVGASGRNGGQIHSGQRVDQAILEAQAGLDTAKRLWSIAEEAKAEVLARIERHAIRCDPRAGLLTAAWKKSHIPLLHADAEHLEKVYGYRKLRPLGREETRAIVASERYHGGVLDWGGGHLHPLNYLLGLADAAWAAGAIIHEKSAVTAIEEGTEVRAVTADGAVTASFLVIAGDAYLGRLVPALAERLFPIKTYVVATAPLGEDRAAALIRDGLAVADTKFVLDYYRIAPDTRLIFGGGETYSSGEAKNIAGIVRPPMLRVFPQLKDVPIEYAWGGHVGITLNRQPHFGRLAPNVFFAQGYSGHGVALASLAGRLITEAIAGTAERFDVMASLPVPRFPGGPMFRWPAQVFGMMLAAIRDRL